MYITYNLLVTHLQPLSNPLSALIRRPFLRGLGVWDSFLASFLSLNSSHWGPFTRRLGVLNTGNQGATSFSNSSRNRTRFWSAFWTPKGSLLAPFWSSFSLKSRHWSEKVEKGKMLILAAIHSTFEGLGPPLATQKSAKGLPEADFFATGFLLEISSILESKKDPKRSTFDLIWITIFHLGPPWGPLRPPKGP